MKINGLLAAAVLAAAGLVGLGSVRSAVAESFATPAAPISLGQWHDAVNDQLFDYYSDPVAGKNDSLIPLNGVIANWTPAAQTLVKPPASPEPLPYTAGWVRGRLEQGAVVELGHAVETNDIAEAQSIRADLTLPRGVSSAEGAVLLQSLGNTKPDDATRLIVREAITWQTTRVRALLDEALQDAQHDVPMPNRMLELLGEISALADLPPVLRDEAGVSGEALSIPSDAALQQIAASGKWTDLQQPLAAWRDNVESHLPSLLSDKEKVRRERLLLKLVQLIPKEYVSGVRQGQITVPLEYHEAAGFLRDAKQAVGELAPLWLADKKVDHAADVRNLDAILSTADEQIAKIADPDTLHDTLHGAAKILTDKFGISLRLIGNTADIVDEVMLETRTTLSSSLASALAGQWSQAENLRVEAYTTYDPDLEARLMPRDPQLAMDIERLLLDGIDQPGVKLLLDRHADSASLQAAYGRVNDALGRAATILKTGVSPAAAVTSAASIVLREGLEGLLVIIAILAGLRGVEHARARKLFWLGIVASVGATAITWILSQTIITSLHAYGEIIEAVTGILAIAVLLLITNWLFQQVYWRQWVTTLKSHAAEESAWQLISVGFLVGYREGFETVLFLQSLILDGGGKSVSLGVLIGSVLLIGMGVAALRLGMKLPYYKILLLTAGLIGLVLITFVGGTIRSFQTVGWLPVHRLTNGSWPLWIANWFGLHNTVESVGVQVLTVVIVIGTWQVARWNAKRKCAAKRAKQMAAHKPVENCGYCETACTVEEAAVAGPCAAPEPLITLTQNATGNGRGVAAEHATRGDAEELSPVLRQSPTPRRVTEPAQTV
jgi:high-affinity iron transporter